MPLRNCRVENGATWRKGRIENIKGGTQGCGLALLGDVKSISISPYINKAILLFCFDLIIGGIRNVLFPFVPEHARRWPIKTGLSFPGGPGDS